MGSSPKPVGRIDVATEVGEVAGGGGEGGQQRQQQAGAEDCVTKAVHLKQGHTLECPEMEAFAHLILDAPLATLRHDKGRRQQADALTFSIDTFKRSFCGNSRDSKVT